MLTPPSPDAGLTFRVERISWIGPVPVAHGSLELPADRPLDPQGWALPLFGAEPELDAGELEAAIAAYRRIRRGSLPAKDGVRLYELVREAELPPPTLDYRDRARRAGLRALPGSAASAD